MMTSKEVENSITFNAHSDKEDSVMITFEALIKTDESNDDGVCVYRVPKSLSCAKPEAFTPQFVGLGPYHHSSLKVYVAIEKLKVTKAKKKLTDFSNYTDNLKKSNFAHTIRSCYDSSIAFKDDTLLYLMTVDALFLHDLLNCSSGCKEEGPVIPVTQLKQNISKLIEKRRMPLVNDAGAELTMDAVIRDVFMLENQIPTCILQRIITEIPSKSSTEIHTNVDEARQDFCTILCPFVTNKSLKPVNNNNPAHLLDHMYHLIVPDPESVSHPNKTTSENESASEDKTGSISKPEAKNSGNICMYLLNVILVPILLMVGSVYLILKLLTLVFSSLFGTLDKLVNFCHPVAHELHKLLSAQNNPPVLKPFAKCAGVASGAFKDIQQLKQDMEANKCVIMPSVTEIHKAGIAFHPADGGISSIRFDCKECKMYLPSIRLDVNSEIIMRNLVAYESLIKSENLILTGYTELMRAIINTAEDVKLLVDEKIIIIQTDELTPEVVAQLFSGMNKSIKPTKTSKLDDEIDKVKSKVHSAQKLCKRISYYGKFCAALATLVFLALTVVQTYCSVFGCSRSSKSGNVLEHGDYGRNNYFVSSM